MEDHIQIGRRLVPLEDIALVETYAADAEKPLLTVKEFRSRIVMRDKDSVLSEEPLAHFIEVHGFRVIQPDGIATNPRLTYWIEKFEPNEGFRSDKPFLSRLLWRAQNGMARSRLLLATPETVLAIAVRGLPDPEAASLSEARPLNSRRMAARRRTAPAREPV